MFIVKKIYSKITRKSLLSNVLTVLSGTVAVQLIGFLFMPFITRLYGPEAFGVYGVFISIAGILIPIASLKYEKAIVLPKSDNDAIGLMKISILIALFISLTTIVLLYIFNNWIVTSLQTEKVSKYLFFIPLIIFFTAASDVVRMWLIRTEKFKITAIVSVYKTLLINVIKTVSGYFYPFGIVLITLETFGRLMQAAMYLKTKFTSGLTRRVFSYSDKQNIKKLIKEYSDFPIYRAPQTLVNAVSQGLPVLLLSAFFGPATAGFLTLGKKVLTLPATLISKSVGDVLYPRFARLNNENEKLSKLVLKSTYSLFFVGLIPYGAIIFFGPFLFSVIFGDSWTTAGEYAKWLSIYLLFAFTARPSIEAIPVLKMQGIFLVIEIVSSALSIMSFLLGYYYFNSDTTAIALFSLSFAIRYIVIIIIVIKNVSK